MNMIKTPKTMKKTASAIAYREERKKLLKEKLALDHAEKTDFIRKFLDEIPGVDYSRQKLIRTICLLLNVTLDPSDLDSLLKLLCAIVPFYRDCCANFFPESDSLYVLLGLGLGNADEDEEIMQRDRWLIMPIVTTSEPEPESTVADIHKIEHTFFCYPESEENFKILNDKMLEFYNNIDEIIFENDAYAVEDIWIHVPFWYLVRLEQINHREFGNFSEFKEALDSLSYDVKAKATIDMLAKMPPRVLDAALRHLSAQRDLEGHNTNVENCQRALDKLSPDHQFYQVRKNQLENTMNQTLHYLNACNLARKHLEDIVHTDVQHNIITHSDDKRAICARPKMEMQQEAENIPDQSINTALGSTAIETETIMTDLPPDMNYLKEIITDQRHHYPDLTGRWIKFDTTLLDRSITRGDVVKQWHLPADAVVSQWDTPNMNPFKIHEFFAGSVQLKAQWNIPKTNQFAASFGCVYHWLQRDRPAELVNIWSVSQQPGGKLHGHSQNSTEIDIPYMSYLPMIPINENNFCMNLYFFTISMIALTDFGVPPDAVDTASLNMYIKFGPDFCFYGQRRSRNAVPDFSPFPRTTQTQHSFVKDLTTEGVEPNPGPQNYPVNARPQMMKATAAKTALSFGNSLAGIGRAAGNSLIGAANSIVKTTVSTATRTMNRAVESSISQGLASLTGNRDKPTNMENNALHQRATTNIASGSGHHSCDVMRLVENGNTPHPQFLFGKEKFASIETICRTEGFVNSFSVSTRQPQGESLFSTHIQLAIAGQVMSGGNFPTNGFLNWTPSDHMAGWFANATMKLHYRFIPVVDGFKTCRLRVAYVPNRRNLSYEHSQSVYYETFDIGPDLNTQLAFDFIVPYINNQLNYNFRSNDNTALTAGSLHVFLETEVNSPGNLLDAFDVLVYKRISMDDFVFSVPRPNISMLIYNEDDVPLPPIPDPPPPILPPEWTNTTVVFQYTRFFVSPGGWNGDLRVTVGANSVTKLVASTGATVPFVLTFSGNIRDTNDHSLLWTDLAIINATGTWNPSTTRTDHSSGNIFVMAAASMSSNAIYTWPIQYSGSLPIPAIEDDYVKDLCLEGIEPNPGPCWSRPLKARPKVDHREEQTETLDLTNNIACLNEAIHGESHMDLITNLRRLSSYHNIRVATPLSTYQKKVLSIPVNTGGAVLRDGMTNLQRADKLIHIHDAMRYFRGSIRLLIMIQSDQDGQFFIEHVPQQRDYPFTESAQLAQSVKTEAGYAESILATRQNVCHQIEMPLYTPSCGVLNASYQSSEYLTNLAQGLGALNFYWIGPAAQVTVSVYRAVGDDAAFYGFNGFPIRQNVSLGPALPFYPDAIAARPQMFKMPRLEQTLDKVDVALDSLAAIEKSTQDFLDKVTSFDVAGNYAGTLLCQIGHIINNPTKTTFALSGAQVFITFGFLKFLKLEKIEKVLGNLWSSFIDTEEDPPTPELVPGTQPVPAQPKGDGDDDPNLSELASVLTAAVVSYSEVKVHKGDIVEKLTFGFTKGGTIYSKIIGFFETSFKYISRVVKAIMKKYFPESKFLKWLEKDIPTDWIRQVTIMTDPTIESKLIASAQASAIVYTLVEAGEEIALGLKNAKRSNGNLARLIFQKLADVKKLQAKFAKNADTPRVKYNPYCFWFAGKDSQIGKSVIVNSLAKKIANETFGLEKCAKPVFVVPESEKFWEGYAGQKIICFDDFGRLNHSDVADSDSARLCAIKGVADFTVPIAFEQKGKLAVPRLVAVASNHSHPTVNGILDKIVWERRNALISVTSDLSVYKTCNDCESFRFSCGKCLEANEGEDFDNFRHLKFVRMNVSQKSSTMGDIMNYQETVKFLIEDAKMYYKHEDKRYADALAEIKDRCEEKQLAEYLVPNKPIATFEKMLESGRYESVINDFGGMKASPKMFKTMLSFLGIRKYDEDEEEILYEACGHIDLDENSDIKFFDGGYKFPGTELDHLPCGKNCLWPYRESDFLAGLDAKFKETGAYPKHFPERFNTCNYALLLKLVREEVTEIKTTKNISRMLRLAAVAAGGLAVIGVGYLFWKIARPSEPVPVSGGFGMKKIPEYDDVKEDKGMDMSPAHPCLMSSDDVKTKFSSRFRVRKSHSSKNWGASGRPKADNELQAMLNTFEMATIDVTIEGEMIKMRAVCVGNCLYATQLHSMLAILTRATCRFKMALSETECDEDCDGANHSTKHMAFAHRQTPIRFTRRVNMDGKCEELEISLADWMFHMNGGTFCVDSAGCDLVIFKLSDKNFKTPSIEKYLITPEVENYLDTNSFGIYDPGTVRGQFIRQKDFTAKNVQTFNSTIAYSKEDICAWTIRDQATFLVHGYVADQIPGRSDDGTCNTALYDKVNAKIVGLMCAGNKDKMFFNTFTKADIDNVYQFYEKLDTKTRTLKWGSNQIRLNEARRKFVQVNKIDQTNTSPKMQVYHSTKTSIKESVCHEKFGPVIRRPCNISQNGDKGQTALVNGLLNYVPHIAFPDEDIAEAVRDIKGMMRKKCKPVIPVVSRRTMHEAICGIPGLVPSLNLATSPGFPWCCRSGLKRKSNLIKIDEDRNVEIHEELQQMVDHNLKRLASGDDPLTIFQISHKDERLALEKLNNVRLIQGSPLDLSLIMRMVLMDFNLAFQENRKNLEHRVGINVESLEWDEMTRSLVDFSPHICVGDYSKFGPRLLSKFVTSAYDIMNDWYRYNNADDDSVIRRTIAKCVVDCQNIAYDTVFKVACGSPSGAINTVVINSICNMLYMRCAWIGIMKRHNLQMSSLNEYAKQVKFFCYGDDVIFAVKPEIIEVFNNQTISDYFKEFDVKYTDVTKGEEMRKFCTIEEASFLKCGFKFFTETLLKPGVWLCQPQLSDIKDTTNWVRIPKGIRKDADTTHLLLQAALANCEDAVRKSWFHGRNTFEEFRDEVESFWKDYPPEYQPRNFDFDGLQREYGYPQKCGDLTVAIEEWETTLPDRMFDLETGEGSSASAMQVQPLPLITG